MCRAKNNARILSINYIYKLLVTITEKEPRSPKESLEDGIKDRHQGKCFDNKRLRNALST